MNNERLRSQFSTLIVALDSEVANDLESSLETVGFPTSYAPTPASALVYMQANLPHILLLHFDSSFEHQDFLRKVKKCSDEIIVILLSASRNFTPCLQAVNDGLAFDFAVLPMSSQLELVQKIDRGILLLYRLYENEQLRAAPGLPIAPLNLSPDKSASAIQSSADTLSGRWMAYLNRMRELTEQDDILQNFIEALSESVHQAPVLYFKFIPQHVSFLIQRSLWLPIESFRGLGFELNSIEGDRLASLMRNPGEIPQLQEMMGELFENLKFTCFAHESDEGPEGFFVVFSEISKSSEDFQLLTGIFDLNYRRGILRKQKHTLEINDTSTGLLKFNVFQDRVRDEVARARRLRHPVSLITLRLNSWERIVSQNGPLLAENALRKLAQFIKNNSRVHDLAGRTDHDQFSLLLPHTDQLGAAVKAERMRQQLQSILDASFKGQTAKLVEISAGVSEYPSLCGDAEQLFKSSEETADQLLESSGPRTGLASAPNGFISDFNVNLPGYLKTQVGAQG
jgi:diguanylate cyclase (GGDEF)-like protein